MIIKNVRHKHQEARARVALLSRETRDQFRNIFQSKCEETGRLTPADPALLGVSISLVQISRNGEQTALMCYAGEEDQKAYREFFRCYFLY